MIPGAQPASRDRLIAMIVLAALLHGLILLGVSFTSGESGEGSAQGLEVLLVSDDLPEAQRNEQATYLAQRTQLGAGTTTERTPLSSPAQRASAARQKGGEDSAASSLHTSAALQPTITYRPVAATPGGDAAQDDDERDGGGSGDASELVLRGSLNRDLMTAPDTRASELAPYLASWRQKVERIGTLNYPRSVRRQSLERNPILEVTLDARGKLLRASITRSSGQGDIDQAALNILKLASPFDPLPQNLLGRYQTLRFAYEWQFVP
ncbi:MAG: TonB family protein [Steroidobacteraceae bacterium]